MPDLAKTMTMITQKLGSPCTISWKALGSGSSASPASSISSYIRISTRGYTDNAGSLQSQIIGTLPPTARSLQGATIQVSGRTYTVVANTVSVFEGVAYQQKVVLGS